LRGPQRKRHSGTWSGGGGKKPELVISDTSSNSPPPEKRGENSTFHRTGRRGKKKRRSEQACLITFDSAGGMKPVLTSLTPIPARPFRGRLKKPEASTASREGGGGRKIRGSSRLVW